MAQEFSPELNAEILASLERRIRENQAREVAAARGEAVRRGVVGGSFEGRRVGAAVAAGGQQSADAAIQLAIENATRLREERLIKEDQAYRTSERLGSQDFSRGERIGSQEWEAGQGKINREWQGTQNQIGRDFDYRLFSEGRSADAMNQRRQGRAELVGGLLNAGGMLGAQVIGAGGLFCFDALTPVTMADGSEKLIKDVSLDDEVKGGTVRAVLVAKAEDRFVYKDVIVSGGHAVKENGVWLRVRDSQYAEPLEGVGLVFSLVTSEHRIFANGIEFADLHETDSYETLTLDQSIAALNESEKAVI